MYHELPNFWKDLLQSGLKDDGWPWDWTAFAMTHKIKAKVVAKSVGVWATEGLVHALNGMTSDLKASSTFKDGQRFNVGDHVLEIEGHARSLHAMERPFLNLAGYVCGIATQTASIVDAVKAACPNNPPRVTLTRKTLPGYRDLAIAGVRAGGGHPHRVSLSGGVLIKENHIASAGGIPQAIRGAKASAPHGLKIEIEVTSLPELKEALGAGAEGVLLDNFTPALVRSALEEVRSLAPRPFIEVSGGLNEANVGTFAFEGVDVLSVGSITHSVKAADFSLLVE